MNRRCYEKIAEMHRLPKVTSEESAKLCMKKQYRAGNAMTPVSQNCRFAIQTSSPSSMNPDSYACCGDIL